MKAQNIMVAENLCKVTEDADCQYVASIMADYNVGSVMVVDNDGRVIGICTDRDLAIRLLAEGKSFQTPVGEVMSRDVKCAHPDDDLQQVEELMEHYKVRRVPIVNDKNELVGFISTADLARRAPKDVSEHEFAEVMETICKGA